MKNLSNKELLAWAAGFIDGEGCLYLHPSTKKAPNGERYKSPCIRVIQTSKEPLERLALLLGGKVREISKPTKSGKKLWEWGIYGSKRTIPALEILLPYLIVKAPEAKLLISVKEVYPYPSFSIQDELSDLKRRESMPTERV